MASKKKSYLLRTYDTYWHNVLREIVVNADNDDSAINIARTSAYLLMMEDETLEVQVCRKGLGMGEWNMFATVYYYDNDIVVDDCYC
jgi:hypothetical protein